MPTAIGASYLTLVDWAKRLDPDGKVAYIVEALVQSNPILTDAAAVQGNLPTGHRTTVRTGLPTVGFRLVNEGVATSKSTTKQVDEQCAMIFGIAKVDSALVALNGNSDAFRASEDKAWIEAMNQQAASTLLNGNQSVNPEQFTGWVPRYNLTTGETGANIILAGGAGADNTSLWLITWGPQTAHLIFPKGSKAGVQTTDRGLEGALDSNTPAREYPAYVTWYEWKVGLAVRDWMYHVRIANIDVSDLTPDASSGADLVDLATQALYKRPTHDLGNLARTFWYCNKTVASYLHRQAANKFNVQLSLEQVGGKPVTRLVGIPVHICDAIGIAETLVA